MKLIFEKSIKVNILITGVAGFIGFHTALKLLKRGDNIIGIDNINNYYDQKLKKDRLNHLKIIPKKFKFFKVDLADNKKLRKIFKNNKIDVINLGTSWCKVLIGKPKRLS